MMTWPKYVLLAWIAFSILWNIARVGKATQPATGGVVAVSTLILGGLATLVVIA